MFVMSTETCIEGRKFWIEGKGFISDWNGFVMRKEIYIESRRCWRVGRGLRSDWNVCDEHGGLY